MTNEDEVKGAAGTTPISDQQLQAIIKSAIEGALAAQNASQQHAEIQNTVKKPKRVRPTIDLSSNEGDWDFFTSEWKRYKRQTELKNSDITDELREACSKELRKELHDFVGATTLDICDEDTLLAHIKTLAVRGKNKAVHRKEFYSMRQAPLQPVQTYVSQLKSKAAHCNFTLRCSSDLCNHQSNSYMESMVSDQMVVGCNDTDIQEEILAKDGTLDSFKTKFDLIQAMEDGKRAKSQLVQESPASTLASSRYQQSKKSQKTSSRKQPSPQKPTTQCQGCGSSDHGPGTDFPRAPYCPARDIYCDHCHRKGHFSSVCRQKLNASSNMPQVNSSGHNTFHATDNADQTSYFFANNHPGESTFSKEVQNRNKLAWEQRYNPMERTKLNQQVIVPHMEWSEGGFTAVKPRPLPQINAKISILHNAHNDFKKGISQHDLQTMKHGVSVSCYTDTGAQTCACGPELLDTLNLNVRYLIPTSHRIIGVTQSFMHIIGIALVKIEAAGRMTNQVVYINKNISGFFLSQSAQADLGIIPKRYTTPNMFSSEPTVTASYESKPSPNTCVPCARGCPQRTAPPQAPTQLPFTPTPENREKLEKWLLQHYASSAFNVCEHQQLPKMNAKPLNIHFRPAAEPKAFHCPIPVPHHWKKQVKANLDRDVKLGIIEPVPPGTPTLWCSKMVVVAKKDGSPRRTVDLQHLNAATYRETHHTPSPFNQAMVVPPDTKKTVLDAWNGYHSLPQSPAASESTTFITEWGRYRYLSSPQGFHAAGDGYTKAFDDITVDFPRKAKCIDDTVMWDNSIEEAFWHTLDYVNLCASNGVVFNPQKFHFACDDVDFAGFTLTKTGLRPVQQILNAIKNFPTPTNITGARSWFGLINQVAYAFAMADEMLPFRDLLKTGRKWYWDENLNSLFEKSKAEIAKLVERGVRAFEVGRQTCLATDWSKHGVGFVLLQKFCTCNMDDAPNCCKDGWHLIFAGSRFTTDAKSRYAPAEGEALAVTYALEKCRIFVLVCHKLLLAVDHKPLVKILGDRSLEDIKNPRLFNLKEKTLMYDYTIKHVPGAWHMGPDACSRYPSKLTSSLECFTVHAEHNELDASLQTNNFVESSVLAAMSGGGYTSGIDISVITLERVKEASCQDNEITSLIHTIIAGFPDKKEELPDPLQPYWNVKEELSCIDGVVLYQNRIVVPRVLRSEILENLHSAHQGSAGMKARARASVFWPGINGAIESRRASCKTCCQISPSQPAEPMLPSPPPEYPFDQVVSDFFNLSGRWYLVYADRYTGWVSIIKTPPGETGSIALKKHLRDMFCAYGVPNELAADGGPPFPSYDVQSFLKAWGVRYRQSSAYYAQSNGRAELAVKVSKRILLDNVGPAGDINNDKVTRALLQHRNTPLQEIGLSPAQILYGRALRDCIPTSPEAIKIRPEWRMIAEDRERSLAQRNIINMERYNEHTKSLPALKAGDIVAVQNQTGPHPKRWQKTGVVVEVGDHRQYTVRMDGSRRCTLRNRRFLKKIQPLCSDGPLRHATTPTQSPNQIGVLPTSPQERLQPGTMLTPDIPSVVQLPAPTPQPPLKRLLPSTPLVTAPRHLNFDTPHITSPNVCTGDNSASLHSVPSTDAHADTIPKLEVPAPRRSLRDRHPPRALSPCFQGQSHNYTDISASSHLDQS